MWAGAVLITWILAISAARWHCGSWRGVLEALRGRPVSATVVRIEPQGDKHAVITVRLRNLLPRTLTVLGGAPG